MKVPDSRSTAFGQVSLAFYDGFDAPALDIGCGIHPFGDPSLADEFYEDKFALNVA